METELGREVLRLRQDRGWSQRELGRRADVSNTAVGKLETGAVDSTADTIIKVADALDIPREHALRLSGILETPPPPTDLDERVYQQFRRLGAEHKRAVAHIVAALAGVGGGERPSLRLPRSTGEEGDGADEVVEPSVEYRGSLAGDQAILPLLLPLFRMLLEMAAGGEMEGLRQFAIAVQEHRSASTERTTQNEPGRK